MSYNLQIIFSVGLGGALGSILRFYAVDYIHKLGTNSFPLGILFVNMLGSFIIGMLYAYFSTQEISTIYKAFLISGFLGGLTTFSTFALDSYLLLNTSLNLAILNIISNLLGSIILVLIGFKLVIFLMKWYWSKLFMFF